MEQSLHLRKIQEDSKYSTTQYSNTQSQMYRLPILISFRSIPAKSIKKSNSFYLTLVALVQECSQILLETHIWNNKSKKKTYQMKVSNLFVLESTTNSVSKKEIEFKNSINFNYLYWIMQPYFSLLEFPTLLAPFIKDKMKMWLNSSSIHINNTNSKKSVSHIETFIKVLVITSRTVWESIPVICIQMAFLSVYFQE